jgi:hypothetical protein
MSDAHKILGFGKTYGVKLYDTHVPLNVSAVLHLVTVPLTFGCINGIIYKMDIISGKSIMIFQTELSKKNYADFIDSSGS